MKEEKVQIICEKCGHQFVEQTDQGEWNYTSNNCFGYIDAIAVCPKCKHENYFPTVREEHRYINNLILEKLEHIKVHPIYLGMMLNIEYPIVMREILGICSENSQKSPVKLKQILDFVQSKECKNLGDFFMKAVEFTGSFDKENKNIHEMIIYLKCDRIHYLYKQLKKKGLLYQYDKNKREYRFDCVYENFLFHHIVYNSKDKKTKEKYKSILPYLISDAGIDFLNKNEAEKYCVSYEYYLKERENNKNGKENEQKRIRKGY